MLVTEWVFKLLYCTVTRVVLSKIREVGQNTLPRSFLSLHNKEAELKGSNGSEKREFSCEK